MPGHTPYIEKHITPPVARPPFPILFRPLAFLCLLALGACAAQQTDPPVQVVQSGRLPDKGTICLRSGLEWMDETSPLFQRLEAALVPLLRENGLTVVTVAPSAPMQEAARRKNKTGVRDASRPLRLERYDIPEQDADLPASVLAVRPPDARTVLFARSQQQGMPVMPRWGRIPGRVPAEVGMHDHAVAEYALVCRFAAIEPPQGLAAVNTMEPDAGAAAFAPVGEAIYLAQLDDIVTAAGPVRGVGAMGYGAPAPSSRPPSSYGSTPGDYRRGYEGPSPIPGDPWNRESDFKARDYTTRHGPQPEFAAPPQGPRGTPSSPRTLPTLPKPPLPGDQDGLPGGPDTAPTRPASPLAPPQGGGGTDAPGAPDAPGDGAGYALEMELYALDATRKGQSPVLLWRAEVRQQAAAAPGLGAALPGMAAHALQKKQ